MTEVSQTDRADLKKCFQMGFVPHVSDAYNEENGTDYGLIYNLNATETTVPVRVVATAVDVATRDGNL